MQLAQAGAAELGRRIPVLGIDPQALADLAADGIIREVRPGQTARFVHDIYFEWAFLQLLVSKHAQWIDMVRQIGEPPVLGRVIELLSQAELTYGEEWKTYLDQLEATTNIRTQWLRAWMLGPFGLIGIGAQEQIYDEAMFADNAKRVAKLAVWFQAEKTKANPIAFDTARFPKLTLGQRLFYADFLAFPSDFEAWRRFCNWLVKHIARIPASTRSDVLAVFEVWQNAFADFPNDVSHAIVRLVHDWLADIEGRENTGSLPRDRGDWDALKSGEREDIESRCRALLLRAGRAYPSLVLEYLSSLRALERMPRSAFKEVMVFSLVLSEECPAGLVELALHSLLEPLPEEIARRASKLPYGSSFSSHDWRSLSVEDNYEFFPSAPTREPFKALFSQEPNEARRLVRQLTNHAIESWRQLHNFHYEGRGNPIPLTLNFPWGEQTFWGASQEYLWSRGTWGPHAVSSGLMALEVWALSQIDEGRAVDDILREVLEGQDAVGALGVAVAIVLERQHCSEVSLPLITSQRLWDWDIQRRMSDLGQSSNLIGFKPGEELHQAAVVAGNKLVSRKTELRSMASICVLRGGELGERASAAIVAFPKSLPFNYEEEKEHADHVSNLKRTAEIWAEVGKKENYRATPAENGSKVLIEMNNPKAQGSDFDAINRRQAEMEAHYRLINWVNHFFETKSIDEKLPLEKAVVAAKQLETKTLFDRAYSHSSSDYLKQAAVAGVASVVLNQAAESSDDFEWAAKVCTRAGTTPEALDELFFSGSILVHHPVALSIPGLSAMLRHDKTRRDAQLALTALAAHYYEQIVVESIGAMLSVWDSHPDIAWNALDLAISLSIFDRPSFDAPPDERDAEARRKIDATVQKSLDRTNEPNFSTTALPALPPAWVQSPDGPRLMRGRRGRNVVVEWEHSSQAVHTNLLAKVLAHIPIDVVMADAIRRELFLAWFDGLVNWTIERVSPSWSRTTGQERFEANSSELFEWRRILFRFCARLALHLELEDGARRYIEPANACDDETFSSLMVSFVETLACRFMDEVEPLPQAIALLMRVVPRMVISGSWKRAAWNEGTLTDTELSRMVQAVFFVDVEKAIGAARFANGDWTDIRSVLPLTDALVKEHGQTPTVASAFLTRCERAFTAYPLGEFVSQLPLVLGQDGMPPGWRESRLPARLAGLIQRFSEKTQPLPVSIARSLLAALDMLVDMGDRRAAAVQTSEVFKGIRTA
ncbi:MAG: hypothetical protein ING69_02580 [Rhodocyclaceae bacterium]|nr:hypothetical protein [Rhodocyclaceae bacterium]MCA3081522.1 hypothetical protein [Rhodocyclaceae bacterium]